MEDLGDGRKIFCDRFNTDLSSVTLRPGPHVGCNAGEYDGPITGCNIVEVGFDIILFAVASPSLPIYFLFLGIIYSNSIGNASPRKQEITREVNFGFSLNRCHEKLCERGNCILN